MARLSECHVFECENCYEKFLILESPRRGDTVKCLNCKKTDEVESIVGEFRDDEDSKDLEVTRPTDLI